MQARGPAHSYGFVLASIQGETAERLCLASAAVVSCGLKACLLSSLVAKLARLRVRLKGGSQRNTNVEDSAQDTSKANVPFSFLNALFGAESACGIYQASGERGPPRHVCAADAHLTLGCVPRSFSIKQVRCFTKYKPFCATSQLARLHHSFRCCL